MLASTFLLQWSAASYQLQPHLASCRDAAAAAGSAREGGAGGASAGRKLPLRAAAGSWAGRSGSMIVSVLTRAGVVHLIFAAILAPDRAMSNAPRLLSHPDGSVH